MPRIRPAARCFQCAAFSTLVGAIADAAAARIIIPDFWTLGLLVGGAVGLVFGPLAASLLWRRSLARAALLVIFPTFLVAAVGAFSGDVLAAALSLLTYLAMLLIARLALPDTGTGLLPGFCAGCGYQLDNLPSCPECGRPATRLSPPVSEALPPIVRRRLIIMVLVFGLAGPLGAAAFLAYERHRSRTPQEWVERLGDHDIQIQVEARTALIRLGDPAFLIQALAHPDPNVRRNAAWALDRFPTPAVRAALAKALSDPDRLTRDRAALTLMKFPPP